LLVDLLAALDIMTREPAAYAFGLQIGVQALGEFLVLGGVLSVIRKRSFLILLPV